MTEKEQNYFVDRLFHFVFKGLRYRVYIRLEDGSVVNGSPYNYTDKSISLITGYTKEKFGTSICTEFPRIYVYN